MATDRAWDDKLFLQVDVTKSFDSPQGFIRPGENYDLPTPPIVEREYKDKAIDFLSRAGFPVGYVNHFGGMGAGFGFEIDMAMKSLGLLPRAIGLIRETRTSQRRTARRRLWTKFNMAITVNRTQNAVLPALAILPELVDHLKEEFPLIRTNVTLRAPVAGDFPCTVGFAVDTIDDKQVLAAIKFLQKHRGEGQQIIGHRKRQGVFSWTQRNTFADENELYDYMDPELANKKTGPRVNSAQ